MAARLDPELEQRLPCVVVGLERLSLPAAAIQRHHQLRPRALPQRLGSDQLFEHADDVAVTTQCELGIDQVLDASCPKLLETSDLAEGEVRAHRAPGARGPRKRASAAPSVTAASARSFGLGRSAGVLDQLNVQFVRSENELVTARAGHDPVLAERSPQCAYVPLHDLRCRRRHPAGPETVHDAIHGDELVCVDQQQPEQRARLTRGEIHRPCLHVDLERPENPEFHQLVANLTRLTRTADFPMVGRRVPVRFRDEVNVVATAAATGGRSTKGAEMKRLAAVLLVVVAAATAVSSALAADRPDDRAGLQGVGRAARCHRVADRPEDQAGLQGVGRVATVSPNASTESTSRARDDWAFESTTCRLRPARRPGGRREVRER